MKTIAPILACILLSGCSWFAHKPKPIEAPDFSAIHQASDRAEKSTDSAVKASAKAGEHLSKAKARHGEAIASHKAEESHIADAGNKVEDLQMRVTVELRPEVDALAGDIAQLRAQHSTTNAALLDTGTEIGESTVAAAEALKAAQQASVEQSNIRTILAPRAEAQAMENARKCNVAEAGWAKADAERLHLLGQKNLLIGISVISIIAAMLLKFYKPL